MATTPEDRLTGWLRRKVATRGVDLIGDDAAFVPTPGEQIAVTVDQQIAGVHFPEHLEPRTIGKRLVLVNLSDVAAIGGLPAFGFLALASPPSRPVREILRAAEETLAAHGAVLAGGDMASGKQLTMSLTLLARRRPRTRWVTRSAARPGDSLWIGDAVGLSALGQRLLATGSRFQGGRVLLELDERTSKETRRCAQRAILHHVAPRPQLELGAWLSRRRRTAAIDVSDGLLLDLERLCRASGVGAVLEASQLPTAAGFADAARLVQANPDELALSGGEDYVLLFALPPTLQPPRELGAVRIGSIRRRPGIDLRGAARPRTGGWDHLES